MFFLGGFSYVRRCAKHPTPGTWPFVCCCGSAVRLQANGHVQARKRGRRRRWGVRVVQVAAHRCRRGSVSCARASWQLAHEGGWQLYLEPCADQACMRHAHARPCTSAPPQMSWPRWTPALSTDWTTWWLRAWWVVQRRRMRVAMLVHATRPCCPLSELSPRYRSLPANARVVLVPCSDGSRRS